MKLVQASSGEAVCDRIAAQSQLEQLSPRDDAMLAIGKFPGEGRPRLKLFVAHSP
jgi:hypothetical protein